MDDGALIRLADGARARIIWGDPVEEVRQGLLHDGCDPAQADAILRDAVADRARTQRMNGIRDCAIGLGPAVYATVVFVTVEFRGRARAWVFASAIAASLAAVRFLFRGRVVRSFPRPWFRPAG